jgi:ATP-dependent helicase/nuclease subunit B
VNERSGASLERATIVVESTLAARQWELASARETARGRAAWLAPDVVPYDPWLETLWVDELGEIPPLTPDQSHVLWRRVIDAAPTSAGLIGHEGVAGWAAAAWRLLHEWRLDLRVERAGPEEGDYREFLGWARRYQAELARRGFVDRAELEGRLAKAALDAPRRVEFADLHDDSPARRALRSALEQQGWLLGTRGAAGPEARCRFIGLADAADELRTALAWARARLERSPEARIAVVVAGLGERWPEVERQVETEFPSRGRTWPVWTGRQPLADDPSAGAALTGLSLLGQSATFATFSRWLRSPLFAAWQPEGPALARLDARLRAELKAQADFEFSYRHGGVAERLARDAPSAAQALMGAMAEIAGGARRTPVRWAHAFSRALVALGWQQPRSANVLSGWHAALDTLMHLSAVLGEISFDAALRELERILLKPRPAPLPVRGVHLLASIDEVGPGYAAAWVTGFTDAHWPEPARANPLLPRRLQRAHGMPMASPRDARERSAQRLARLTQSVPELVVSWPRRVFDYEAEPSPAIRAWPELAADEADVRPRAAARLPRRRETLTDPPPAFAGSVLPGGAGMLGRQARCPLRAFVQDRLGARELEPLRFGVSARLRGIAIHRALELAYDALPSQVDHAPDTAQALRCARSALDELFGSAKRPLHALFDLETELLERVLGELLALERRRAPFRVLAVEQRREVALGDYTIHVRLDRLDRLADGGLAILDYKTGKRATPADWLAPRLKDAQIPLYAVQANEPISAVVMVRLHGGKASYAGAWDEAAFPGRAASLRADALSAEVERWKEELVALAAEFARGDTRLFTGATDEAEGSYAPLTRVHEQLALRRGALPEW